MPGIIQQQLSPKAPAQLGATQPSPQAGSTAQPEPDSKAVERVVMAALKIIHDPKIGPGIVQMMKDAGDPVQALAKTTLIIMREIYQKSNQSIPGDVLAAAGVEVMNELAMVAIRKKLYNITPEIFQQAVQLAMQEAQQETASAPAAPAGPATPQPAVPPVTGV